MAVNVISGLAQGLAQAHGEKLKEQQNEEIKKLQIKLFKQQLESQEQQKQAANQFLGLLQPEALMGMDRQKTDSLMPEAPEMEQVNVGGRGLNLTRALADPEGQRLALKGGLVKATDLQNQGILDMLTGGMGGQGPGGLTLSGVKLDPRGRPMYDFSRPTAKTFQPDPQGGGVIPIDQFGRPMKPVRTGPSDVSLSPGQKKVDQDFAATIAEFNAGGGFADVQKQLAQLRGASEMLGRPGASLTGPVIGSLPDWALSTVNPEAMTVKELIQESAQRNLRVVLGAQFTEKEGERLLARVFNPRLGEAENKRRADRLIQQIQQAALSKQEAINYFQEHGTLKGFKGKIWTMADFNPDKPSLSIKNNNKPSDAVPKGVDPEDWKYLTPEQKKLWKR